MSAVTKEDIEGLARLARLELEEDEVLRLREDLSGILDHMEQLAEVDTEGVAPMTHAMPSVQALRPDVTRPSLPRERVLAACARTEDEHFAVPSILPSGDDS